MMLLPFLLLFWTTSGSTAEITKINCTIMNLEYINCTWDDGVIPKGNYTFKSRSLRTEVLQDCTSYLKKKGVNVGCLLPYKEKNLERFDVLHAQLYGDNGRIIAKYENKLMQNVKLAPPVNLMVKYKSPELWLYWNSTNKTGPSCKESEVRYRTNGKDWRIQASTTEKNSFNLPFANKGNLYEFQVRVRMSNICGKSETWSDWSESVCWGSLKDNNDTETRLVPAPVLMVLYTVGAAVVLIILSCLLVHSERLRVILIPVVPNPKNLADLIDSYDGNVEKWLSISKELQDGFKPNFTERTCPVREHRLMSQCSTESDVSLSGSADLSSDYQSMHCCSSTSSLMQSTEACAPDMS